MKTYRDTHKWSEGDNIIGRNIEPHFMMQYRTNISGDKLKLFYDLYKHNWMSKITKGIIHLKNMFVSQSCLGL